VGNSFTTARANAVSAGSCAKPAALSASATASPDASTCSRALTSWACSVSSWHFASLLFSSWAGFFQSSHLDTKQFYSLYLNFKVRGGQI